MTLSLTPETCARAYDYLASTPPFCRWNLPDSEDVMFKVTRSPGFYGRYSRAGKKVLIEVSAASVGHTTTLMETMAHEMVHLHEGRVGDRGKGEHSAAFKKWGLQVCRHHGFDPRRF